MNAEYKAAEKIVDDGIADILARIDRELDVDPDIHRAVGIVSKEINVSERALLIIYDKERG